MKHPHEFTLGEIEATALRYKNDAVIAAVRGLAEYLIGLKRLEAAYVLPPRVIVPEPKHLSFVGTKRISWKDDSKYATGKVIE